MSIPVSLCNFSTNSIPSTLKNYIFKKQEITWCLFQNVPELPKGTKKSILDCDGSNLSFNSKKKHFNSLLSKLTL